MKKLNLLIGIFLLAFMVHGQNKFLDKTYTGQKTLTNKVSLRSIQINRDFKVPHHKDYPRLNVQSIMLNGKLKISSYQRMGASIALEGEYKDFSVRNKPDFSGPLQAIKDILPLVPQKQNLSVQAVEVADSYGWHTVRVLEQHQGLPVYGGEAVMQIKGTQLRFIGRLFKIANSLPEAVLSKTQALAKAREDVKQHTKLLELNKADYLPDHLGKNELVVYPEGDQQGRLAYHIEFFPNYGDHWFYLIDALTGVVIKKHSQACKLYHDHHELFGGPATGVGKDLAGKDQTFNTFDDNGTHYLFDVSRSMFKSLGSSSTEPVGVIITFDAKNTSPENDNFKTEIVTNSSRNWNNPTAISAHVNAGLAYEYLLSTFKRNSINGLGGNIYSIINVVEEDGSSMENAFWNGAAMFYGNGGGAFNPLARALDVAGHEMFHGVVQNTANLEYEGESGALNESFADIFGAMIDREDWQMGEDVVKKSAFPSGALRDLSNPHNGGTSLRDPGFQPRTFNERYTGTQDNGGVHINSGIPNWAFFKIATALGKPKAEQIFYRALSEYLVRSSQFVDLRNAVVMATKDIHGANAGELTAINTAFDEVGIVAGQGGDYQEDVQTNPGQDVVAILNGSDDDHLYLTNAAGQLITDALSENPPNKRPSVTDDGSALIYASQDGVLRYIVFDWIKGEYQSDVLDDQIEWGNAAISKDGTRFAAIPKEPGNLIYVYDFDINGGEWREFELYNPTFTEGVTTGDVLRPDVLEFDFTGEYLMYDAENKIESQNGNSIQYWDIGFLHVFDQSKKTWGSGRIEKLFSSLPENTTVGNPTFSKNSPYIIAFDLIDENVSPVAYFTLGANLETLEIDTIVENNVPGEPTYSRSDDRILVNTEVEELIIFTRVDLYAIPMAKNKISIGGNPTLFRQNASSAYWFGTGSRDLVTSLKSTFIRDFQVKVYPNPAAQISTLEFINQNNEPWMMRVFRPDGALVVQKQGHSKGVHHESIVLNGLPTGLYLINLTIGAKTGAVKVWKK